MNASIRPDHALFTLSWFSRLIRIRMDPEKKLWLSSLCDFASGVGRTKAWDFCNLRLPRAGTVGFRYRSQRTVLFTMMNSLARIPSWVASNWRTSAVIACAAFGIVITCRSYLETDEARNKRVELNREKELRKLADRISIYGRKVHARYPSGDVVVSVHDLAQQLRKHPDTVATALKILLGEQRVQQAALNGYWKLNV